MKLKNKTTIDITAFRLIIGRQINQPIPPNPVGWHRIFMLNLSGHGGWKNILWIKGILEYPWRPQ